MTVTPTQAEAFWVEEPWVGKLRREDLAHPGPDEVLVRARFGAVSRGSEALVFRGEVPDGEKDRMRAPHQRGEFPAPVKYGYINVGEVERGPRSLEGRTVFCLHPHQDRYVVPAEAVLPLPTGVPASRAVLAANLETAINGLWDGAPRAGDHIAVVGAGAVGCLVAWLAGRIPGCRVQLVDINPARAPVAQALGVDFALPGAARPEVDLVFHASGSAGGLERSLSLAGFEATIVEMSWFGTREVALHLGREFHARRLTLRSSQVGSVAPARRARWSPRRRLGLALSLLSDPAPECLITGESPFAELPEVMRRLAERAGGTICHRIAYA